jgi:cobalt-precorrin 5A hydrolase / precorrin-3B C17-methyltransferase
MTRVCLVSVTEGGRRLAGRLAAAWPDRTMVHSGPVADQIRAGWTGADALVCFLATGATVRLVAPLLTGKHTDPGVVCVDEAGRYAVALLGGHAGGANALATRVAAVLDAQPVLTTASDAVGVTGLDGFGADLGFRLVDPAPVARCAAAMLAGAAVVVAADAIWPLPALPPGDADLPPVLVTISDRLDAGSAPRADLIYRPPSLVVGVGASRGVSPDEVDELVGVALADAGLAAESVRCLATIDVKAAERGIRMAATRRGWPVVTFTGTELSAVDVPNPSEVVRASVGTGSVAEAAALLAAHRAGRHAELVVPKRTGPASTAAVARLTPRGRLTLVGLGPGAEDLRTPRAVAALRRAGVVVGLDQYLAQVRTMLTPGTRVVSSPIGSEHERVRSAVTLAREGHAVALVGSGDAGVYAMGSPALQIAGADIDVEVVPGVTAALAAAASLGAPLGHDHAYLSLSDLHTPWPVIAMRLRACATADLVVCLYNPRSHGRARRFDEAIAILAEHRDLDTPVGLVRDASRPGERVVLTTLGGIDPAEVGMRSMVIVGASSTRQLAGRMVTPRGYRWQP